MSENFHFQSGGGVVKTKPRFCECGEPAASVTSNREPICDRCRDLERARREVVNANKLVGVAQDTTQNNNLPLYLVEVEPIAGGSLEILDAMLCGVKS